MRAENSHHSYFLEKVYFSGLLGVRLKQTETFGKSLKLLRNCVSDSRSALTPGNFDFMRFESKQEVLLFNNKKLCWLKPVEWST